MVEHCTAAKHATAPATPINAVAAAVPSRLKPILRHHSPHRGLRSQLSSLDSSPLRPGTPQITMG